MDFDEVELWLLRELCEEVEETKRGSKTKDKKKEEEKKKNALQLMMETAKHPGAFAFPVHYPPIDVSTFVVSCDADALDGDGSSSEDDSEIDICTSYNNKDEAAHYLLDLWKKLDSTGKENHDFERTFGEALAIALKRIQDTVMSEHYRNKQRMNQQHDCTLVKEKKYQQYEFYPLFCMDDKKKKNKGRMRTVAASASAASTTTSAFYGSPPFINSNSASPAPQQQPYAPPFTEPSKGSYLTSITACFGSKALKKKSWRAVMREEDEEEDDEMMSLEEEEDEDKDWCLPILDERDKSSYWTYDDDYDYYDSTKKDTRPFLPIIGFILRYSDGVELEVGHNSLKGTISQSTLELHDSSERIAGIEQHFSHNSSCHESKQQYPISIGIHTSDDRYVFFEKGSLKADFGGEASFLYSNKYGLASVKDDCTTNNGPFFLEWDTENKRIKSFSSPYYNTPSINHEGVVDAAEKSLREEKKHNDECKLRAANLMCKLYEQSLHCIRDAAMMKLFSSYLLNLNGKLEELEQLRRKHRRELRFSRYAKRRSRKRLVRQHQYELKCVVMPRDKQAQDNMWEIYDEVMEGVKFHVGRLSRPFEDLLNAVEGIARIYHKRIQTEVVAPEMVAQDSSVCNDCKVEIPDPRFVRRGKRCSVSGCFEQTFLCGCTIQECKIYFTPMCPQHMLSHKQGCASSFSKRCGWKEGHPSLRVLDKFCGSIIEEEENRRLCLYCGVQCCLDCGVTCTGYQPRMYYIPLLGLPPNKKSRFDFQPCAAFCCFGCDQPSRFYEGKCPRCRSKMFSSYDATGYSEPSDMDSDYSMHSPSSSDNDESCDEAESEGVCLSGSDAH